MLLTVISLETEYSFFHMLIWILTKIKIPRGLEKNLCMCFLRWIMNFQQIYI